MNLKENDQIELENLTTGKRKTITVRWHDSRTGILSYPEYEYHRLEENKKFGWTPEWKVIQKLKKTRGPKKGPKKNSRNS
tara:strand:+ start:284 stop:523 length:240 start_codon:yes stop_codon:yes gene_type:complete